MSLLWPLIVVASPGPDRIEYILIVKLPLATKLILLDLLNEIYSLNISSSVEGKSYVFH